MRLTWLMCLVAVMAILHLALSIPPSSHNLRHCPGSCGNVNITYPDYKFSKLILYLHVLITAFLTHIFGRGLSVNMRTNDGAVNGLGPPSPHASPATVSSSVTFGDLT
uniref:Uncharacterized protein n=1 Tax=Leersia perrieri TaxID=77586 RepID=A0A0D9V0Z6_9ORYZ